MTFRSRKSGRTTTASIEGRCNDKGSEVNMVGSYARDREWFPVGQTSGYDLNPVSERRLHNPRSSGLDTLEAGLNEYERGQSHGFGRTVCPPYQTAEVERSRTEQGHLPVDVVEHPRGLLIADFGVDWRTPKPSLTREAALRDWLKLMIQIVRANASTSIRISGYSDCVGRENNNKFLRHGRAQRVRQLLQQLAGPQWGELSKKIAFVGAAPAGEYVADNATVEGRARNRGVLIEHWRIVNVEPKVVPCRQRTRSNGSAEGS